MSFINILKRSTATVLFAATRRGFSPGGHAAPPLGLPSRMRNAFAVVRYISEKRPAIVIEQGELVLPGGR